MNLKKIKAQKSFLVIPTALQYKPLYNINRSEKWGKKIQTAGYNGARTVYYLGKWSYSGLPVFDTHTSNDPYQIETVQAR